MKKLKFEKSEIRIKNPEKKIKNMKNQNSEIQKKKIRISENQKCRKLDRFDKSEVQKYIDNIY